MYLNFKINILFMWGLGIGDCDLFHRERNTPRRDATTPPESRLSQPAGTAEEDNGAREAASPAQAGRKMKNQP